MGKARADALRPHLEIGRRLPLRTRSIQDKKDWSGTNSLAGRLENVKSKIASQDLAQYHQRTPVTAHSRPTGPANCHTIYHDKTARGNWARLCSHGTVTEPHAKPLPQQSATDAATPVRSPIASAATAGIRDAATSNPSGCTETAISYSVHDSPRCSRQTQSSHGTVQYAPLVETSWIATLWEPQISHGTVQ